MFFQHHVNKINDDDAAQIAQPQLAGDGVAGFQIGFEDGFVKIACAHKSACVHINRGHRLGGFNNQIAAKIQINTRLQRAVNLGFHAKRFKQRALALKTLQFFHRALHILLGKMAHPRKVLPRIHQNLMRVVVKHIAQHALRQRQIFIQQRLGRQHFCLMLNIAPHLSQIINIGLQFGIAGVFCAGADDVAVASGFRQQRVEPLAQGVAVKFVVDALRNADVFVLRQMHQKPPRQRNLRGKPRPFAVNRVFNHLHQ